MKEYWLDITPQTHIRTTRPEGIMCFGIFGPLHRIENRSPEEEAEYQKRINDYPGLYGRFIKLVRYNEYKRALTAEAVLKGFWLRNEGMEITFYLPCSRSWRPGKKKKHHHKRHQFKPDVDNLMKAMFDTLKPQQDCQLWHLHGVKKLWTNEPTGSIHIICHNIPED